MAKRKTDRGTDQIRIVHLNWGKISVPYGEMCLTVTEMMCLTVGNIRNIFFCLPWDTAHVAGDAQKTSHVEL